MFWGLASQWRLNKQRTLEAEVECQCQMAATEPEIAISEIVDKIEKLLQQAGICGRGRQINKALTNNS